jgi:hypothetical protein
VTRDQGDRDYVVRSDVQAGWDAAVAGRDPKIHNYGSQGMPQAVARSAYLEQVRRIAPPDPPGLIGRDIELAELARFCLDPEGAPVRVVAGRAVGGEVGAAIYVRAPAACRGC